MEKRLSFLIVALFLFVGMVSAQTKITGTVIAQEDGQPVIGATIMVQGSKTGTATDLDGHFTLTVPSGKKIQVSYIGMKTQVLTPKKVMKIVLESDQTTLQDVVVTGMQKMDKRLFTGATSKIDAKSTVWLISAARSKVVWLVCLYRMCRVPLVVLPKSVCVVPPLSMVAPNPFGWWTV